MPRDPRDAVEAYLATKPTTGTEDNEDSVCKAAYVIQEIASNGMRMFANKDLGCGDLIIQENPLVLFQLEDVLSSKSRVSVLLLQSTSIQLSDKSDSFRFHFRVP